MSPRTPKPDGRPVRPSASRPTDLRRKHGTREEKDRFLVIGEGPTEVGYLTGLKRRGIVLEVRHYGDLDHRSVVARAVRLKQGPDEYDAVWCVLDTELDREMTREMLAMAAAGDVRLALSAPCFDFWLLLHQVDHRRIFQSAGEVERKLKSLMPTWDKGNTKFRDFQDGLPKAMDRARVLDPGPGHGGKLFSEVWRLVEFLGAS
ncbi:RloB family protein [Actinocorallia sp. A-T 12471]|uniref:RloB family protein n=1 Tax=Actinocorallia sp. A-T 12471 TaxID=3089813 RepID=UPI0029D3C3BF|nr:RloB family protein [Actinocorallia sp. A-T 12471]MDX6738549.1 RloB family protein [Actinocorallia sp. A-T 12471]